MIRTCLLLTIVALAVTSQESTPRPTGNATEAHKGGVAGFFEGIKNGVVSTWNKVKNSFEHGVEQIKNGTNHTAENVEGFFVTRIAELQNHTERLRNATAAH